MYRDVAQWTMIGRKILIEGVSRRQIARQTGISRKTIRKILRHDMPQPYGQPDTEFPVIGKYVPIIDGILRINNSLEKHCRFSIAEIYRYLVEEEGYNGSYGAVRGYIRKYDCSNLIHGTDAAIKAAYDLIMSVKRSTAIRLMKSINVGQIPLFISENAENILFRAIEAKQSERADQSKKATEGACWINSVMCGDITKRELYDQFKRTNDISTIIDGIHDRRITYRNRALIILASLKGVSIHSISRALKTSRNTIRRSLKLFGLQGAKGLFSSAERSSCKVKDQELSDAIFAILHEPPKNYGYVRTSWTMALICEVLTLKGKPACPHVIRSITKNAGYKWRKARTVLTSNDEDYTEKLERVKGILSNLAQDEAFFSIDEFGPFSVKTKAGLTLTAPHEQKVIQQWQRSKGCLILTAAIELSSNQITHFYSSKKDTAEMIRMVELLVDRYGDCRRIFLSWDAASWHMSKKLFEKIEDNNQKATIWGGPIIETAPLPARAQFLNVIESIFSGMARAIIHNSDYSSVEEVKAAIDQYFEGRNAYFRDHPKKAGNKIWGKERELSEFSDSNNCKDPRYR